MIGTKNELIKYLLEQQEEKKFEVKEYFKKRSKDQNAYYWELLNKLSKKLIIPTEELHFELIKKSCPFEEYLVPNEASLRGIRYYEVLAKKQVKDKVFKVIRVYVGTSELDTKEMIVLLDNLIEECKEQGIETITPEELAKLRGLENDNKK
jgi:hypothetical protein